MRRDAGWDGVRFTGGEVTGKGGAEETEDRPQRQSNSPSAVMRKGFTYVWAGDGKGGGSCPSGQGPPPVSDFQYFHLIPRRKALPLGLKQ